MASSDLVRLARFDATTWEDGRHAFVKHVYYGWRQEPVEELVWRQTFKPIGTGGFGAVFSQECTQGRLVGATRAVKVIEKPRTSDARRIDYGAELKAIAQFSKPEYAQFFVHSAGWYEADDTINIIMELIPHGSLHQYIQSGLPESEVQILVSQILQGVKYMHLAGYSHRDLKPQNLLVAQKGPAWHIKIADFGLSKRLAENLSSLPTSAGAGTAGFTAPELLAIHPPGKDGDSSDSENENRRSHTLAVDIWAIGVISYLLLTGDLPFATQDLRPLRKFVRKKAPFPMEALRAKSVSASGCAFTECLMDSDPANRPSAECSLEHCWIDEIEGRSIPQTPTRSSSQTQSRISEFNWDTRSASHRLNDLTLRPGNNYEPPGADRVAQGGSPIVRQEVPSRTTSNLTPEKSRFHLQMILDASSSEYSTNEPRIAYVVFSPDGSLVASSTGWSTIMWNATTGARVHELNMSEGLMSFGPAFSPSNKLVAQWEYCNIRFWDMTTGAELEPLQESWPRNYQPSSLLKAVFSPDDMLFASVGHEGIVKLRDTVSWKTVYSYSPGHWRQSLAFSPDSTRLAIAVNKTDDDGFPHSEIQLLVVPGLEIIRTIPGVERKIIEISFSPNGKRLAALTFKRREKPVGATWITINTVRLWDTATWETWELAGLKSFNGSGGPIAIAWSADSKLIASISSTRVCFWDAASGQAIQSIEEPSSEGQNCSISFSADNNTVAVGAVKGTRHEGKEMVRLYRFGSSFDSRITSGTPLTIDSPVSSGRALTIDSPISSERALTKEKSKTSRLRKFTDAIFNG